MTKAIIILGSSRGKGETWNAIQEVIGNQSSIPLIDLNNLSISPYPCSFEKSAI